MKLFIVYTLFFFQYGCNYPAAKQENKFSQIPDTITVHDNCVVFFKADKEYEKKYTERNPTAAASELHECFYEIRNAKMVLNKNWKDIKYIEATKNTVIKYVGSASAFSYINLSEKKDLCGMLMFKEKTDPQPGDMSNIDTALEYYFHQ